VIPFRKFLTERVTISSRELVIVRKIATTIQAAVVNYIRHMPYTTTPEVGRLSLPMMVSSETLIIGTNMNTAHNQQMKHAATLKVGDIVAFSARFLRSTQLGHSRAMLRGVITQTEGVFCDGFTNSDGESLAGETIPESCCLVSWNNEPPKMVARYNLSRVGSASFAEAPYMGKTYKI
jgi:hypothetical protein